MSTGELGQCEKSTANSLRWGGRRQKLQGQAFGDRSHLGTFSLLPLTHARAHRALSVGGAGDSRACLAGAAGAQRPLPPSFSTGAGGAGQWLRRQLPRSARRGGRDHPAGEAQRRPFVCAAAEGRVRRERAPSCGRSWALRPRRRGATLAWPKPPSLSRNQHRDDNVLAAATALTAAVRSIRYAMY